MSEDGDLTKKLSKEIAKGGSIAFSGKIILKIIGFPIKFLLARFLGASTLGIYSLGKNLVGWGKHFSVSGLQRAALKFIPAFEESKNKKEAKGTIITLLVTSLLLSLVFSGILFFFSNSISNFFNKPPLSPVLIFIAISLPFASLTAISTVILRGFKRIGQNITVSIAKSLLNLTLLGFFFLLGFRLMGAIAAFILSTVLSFLLGIYFIQKNFPNLFSHLKPSFPLKKIFRFSIPLYFASFGWRLTRQIDILMIGFFLPSSSVGIYTVAVTISALVLFPLGAIEQIFSPIISNLHSQGKKSEIKEIYKKSTRWASSASLGVVLIILFFSGDILGFIFGSEFAAGGPALFILSLFSFVFILFGPVGFLLQMTGNQDWVLYINLISAPLNAILNFLLIQLMGILGAALATGTTLAFNNLIEGLIVHKKLGIHPWSYKHLKIIFPLLISVSIFLLLSLTSLHWIITALLIFVSYYISLYLFGLTAGDKKILKKIIGSIIKGWKVKIAPIVYFDLP